VILAVLSTKIKQNYRENLLEYLILLPSQNGLLQKMDSYPRQSAIYTGKLDCLLLSTKLFFYFSQDIVMEIRLKYHVVFQLKSIKLLRLRQWRSTKIWLKFPIMNKDGFFCFKIFLGVVFAAWQLSYNSFYYLVFRYSIHIVNCQTFQGLSLHQWRTIFIYFLVFFLLNVSLRVVSIFFYE